MGVGGTGLIPSRSRDNWGSGYYYDALSAELKNSLAAVQTLRNEQGWDTFYNFEVTPWLVLGADVQIINPAQAYHVAFQDHNLGGLRSQVYANDSHTLLSFLLPPG